MYQCDDDVNFVDNFTYQIKLYKLFWPLEIIYNNADYTMHRLNNRIKQHIIHIYYHSVPYSYTLKFKSFE